MELSRIEATLRYGRFFSGKRLIIIYVCFIISLLLPLVTILIGIMILAGAMEWNNDMVVGLIGGNTFSLFLFVAILWFIINNKKENKIVSQWLEDVIETKAFVRRMDVANTKFKPYQVQVEFEINNNKYQRLSAPGGLIRGYHKIFIRYANKKIKILYSLKHDQVLILRNQ